MSEDLSRREATRHLVTARELAEILGVSASTILNHFEAGKLDGYKIGRAVRFDVDEVLAACRRPTQGGAPSLELLRREE